MMKKRAKKQIVAIALSLSTVLGTGFGGINMVYAANSFKAGDAVKIKYLHNDKTYTKSAVDARWDNKILGTKMPGYIDEDSNAMYSAYWIFGQSEGPKVLYKNNGDTFTLSRYNTTIKMSVDSKTAYINGEKVTMTVAPRKVYNYANKTNYIMVPGSWTAKNLGINYKWDSSKRAGCMSASNQSGSSNSTTTATKPTTTAAKPTTTTAKPTETTAKPTETKPEVVNKKVTTAYDMTASAYAKEQSKAVPKYGNQTFDDAAYQKKITSTVNDEQYLRIDTYHNVNETAFAKKLDEMLQNKTNSVLKGKASAIITAAKKEKIDPVYLLSQTINESAYGTSTLSKKTITKVISGDSVKKDANGNVTGFQKVDGKYITKTIPETTVYNLYGIKAYDSDPQLCGSSYAYYMGWTTVDKALNGAAKYVADNYIHHATYQQNTLFKMRYNPKKDNIWHQYSTNPSYAEEIAEHMKDMKTVYDGCSNTFTYDRPTFVKEPETTTTTATKPTTTTAKATTTTTAVTTPTTVKYTITGTLPNSRVKASKSNYDLRLKLPKGVAKYYLEDKYTTRQLFMSCAGNYTLHFNNTSNRTVKSSMSSMTVKYNADKKRTYVYIKPSSSYRGYAVSFSDGYAYIKWGTPKTMYKNILVLDAGHGGSDSGATGNGLREKDLTLSIVLAAKEHFDKDKNYAVYYTRTTDTYPSLTDRSDLANNVGADYFLSCHINSADATAKGSETLYNSQGYKATNGVTSYKWAANVHGFTKKATGFTDRGLVDRTGLAVLRHTKTASTLTEFGFISNKSEAKSMKANTDKYGEAMYNSVVKMFKSSPSKR